MYMGYFLILVLYFFIASYSSLSKDLSSTPKVAGSLFVSGLFIANLAAFSAI